VEDAISGLYPKGKEEMLTIGVLVKNAETLEEALEKTNSKRRK
jgi:hypothetical protein